MRKVFEISGVVQGVGFRPAVLRLAYAHDIGGSIRNCTGSVELILDGTEELIARFLTALPAGLPPQAKIVDCRLLSSKPLPPADEIRPFAILASEDQISAAPVFPPDLAMCGVCATEVLDPGDRRYGYPFTTCTDCGPRYTVINSTPYDRDRTTLAAFPLCANCRAEYEDPTGRRFHAESIACPDCGPTLTFEQNRAAEAEADVCAREASGRAALASARRLLQRGGILGVRGVGGFLIAANAFSREAAVELRRRKDRPHKPFAVMARSVAAAKRYCRISAVEQAALQSAEGPIVLLDLLPDAEACLPVDLLAPDVPTLGVMLPTSPLHLLLSEPLAGDPIPPFELLIMTSGNRRGEPICIKNDEARERLEGIADAFLVHDREINLRADDSVCRFHGSRKQLWRRGRGNTPPARSGSSSPWRGPCSLWALS